MNIRLNEYRQITKYVIYNKLSNSQVISNVIDSTIINKRNKKTGREK